MPPAAADTILRYFSTSGYSPSDFDMIVTGDLGNEGGSILCELLCAEGLDIRNQYADCGTLIYDCKAQDKHAGGSGCGCSASVLASHFLPLLEKGEIKRIMFMSTGALMSPGSVMQGENILGISPLIVLESDK